jgi:hypothetical protein
VNVIFDQGVQHLARALESNSVRQLLSSSTAHQLLCFNTDTHYAQSSSQLYQRWRSTTSGSCIKEEHGEKNSHPRSQINCYILIQTLTTLDISGNSIDAEGIQHLASALMSNTVRRILPSSITNQLLYFNTDTDHTRYFWEHHPRQRSPISGSCIKE